MSVYGNSVYHYTTSDSIQLTEKHARAKNKGPRGTQPQNMNIINDFTECIGSARAERTLAHGYQAAEPTSPRRAKELNVKTRSTIRTFDPLEEYEWNKRTTEDLVKRAKEILKNKDCKPEEMEPVSASDDVDVELFDDGITRRSSSTSSAELNPSSTVSVADSTNVQPRENLPVTNRYYSSYDPVNNSWTTGSRPARDLDLDHHLDKIKSRRELSQDCGRRKLRYSKKYTGDGVSVAELNRHLPQYSQRRSFEISRPTSSSYTRTRYSDGGSSYPTEGGVNSSYTRTRYSDGGINPGINSSSYTSSRYSDGGSCASDGFNQYEDSYNDASFDEFNEDSTDGQTNPGVIKLEETTPKKTEWTHRSEALTLDGDALESLVPGQLAIEGTKRAGVVQIPVLKGAISDDEGVREEEGIRGKSIPIVIKREEESKESPPTQKEAAGEEGGFKEKVIYSRGTFKSADKPKQSLW
ncbi:hypothetical protein CAPTEDRAFT_199402 [Capitella teleta]|uniref:Uncharacterized protein n=1 Tax=Capitella teleta TaxID=283909 RepID=R7UW99_CAPTE|nr:hypothetical protein CAPTEDRAFT_199402 [Capitella teleta]|eukprot:ELU10903.1 hypothetical protein CAPTEDRAFT_199402 [Capitella teleta]